MIETKSLAAGELKVYDPYDIAVDRWFRIFREEIAKAALAYKESHE